MGYLDIDCRKVYAGSNDKVIYVVDMPEHPFDLSGVAEGLDATLVSIPVHDWNDSLTPWPAEGLYRGNPPFGGNARTTLGELLNEAMPAIEKADGLCPKTRAIGGYSLGGLFALYAFVNSNAFVSCACLSGSVWYEGWTEYLRTLDRSYAGRFAFLSVGTKEKRAARPILRTVQDNMEACASILRERGCEVAYVTSPGNHTQDVGERIARGLAALDVAQPMSSSATT